MSALFDFSSAFYYAMRSFQIPLGLAMFEQHDQLGQVWLFARI